MKNIVISLIYILLNIILNIKHFIGYIICYILIVIDENIFKKFHVNMLSAVCHWFPVNLRYYSIQAYWLDLLLLHKTVVFFL